jgi:hypothetical protein
MRQGDAKIYSVTIPERPFTKRLFRLGDRLAGRRTPEFVCQAGLIICQTLQASLVNVYLRFLTAPDPF